MTLTPINLKTANAFVQQYHRHHKPTRGHKFSIGVSENGALVGVAICGRPVARRLDDGYGAEKSKKVCYYICKARQADDKCIGHQITEKLLKSLIMDQLHLFITQLSDRRKVVEELRKNEDSELKGKKIVYQDHPTPKERQDNIFSMFKDDIPEEMNTEEGNKVLNLILNSSEYAEDWLRYKISKGKL